MTSTRMRNAQNLLHEEDRHCIGVRQNMAAAMKALGCNAILWSESVFGTTNYPLITAESGRTYNVHGLKLNNNSSVCAIIDYPTQEYITGVKSFNESEAAKLISPSMLICAGTPEEWDILGDCLSTAIHILKAETVEKQPLPWW